MNRYEEINTEVLLQDIEKIKNERKNLKDILDDLKNRNDYLKDYWVTQTSEEVFSNFHGFYKSVEDILTLFDDDCDFLKNDVIDPYLSFEEKASSTIESELKA